MNVMTNDELITYCIQHMATKELIHNFFNEKKIYFKKNDTYQKLASRILESNDIKITISELNEYFRKYWIPKPSELHINNLKSGKLLGHSWHNTTPSMLHMSIQNKVRECIDGKSDIEDLINIGSDIMKHEYFMVCVHDLIETMIIESFPNTIPAVNKKSISDFVFNNKPYDLKVTNYINDYTKNYVNNNKEEVAKELISGIDTLRLRKQAEKTVKNMGLNRFFVLVEDQNRWEQEPESIINELKLEIKKIDKPMIIEIDGLSILTQLITI